MTPDPNESESPPIEAELVDDGQSFGEPSEHASGSPIGLEQPRLGIGHFMLWTAGAAVWMGMSRLLQMITPDSALDQTLQQGGTVFASMVLGLALASLPIWVSRRLRKVPFPVEPGEWLLVATGLSVPLTQLIWICGLPFAIDNYQLHTLLTGLAYLVNLFVFLIPLFCFRKSKTWMVFFLSVVVADVLRLGWLTLDVISFSLTSGSLFYLINEVVVFAQGVALFVALILDRNQARHRGWLHWTGVVMFSCLLTLNFFWWVYYHWFFE